MYKMCWETSVLLSKNTSVIYMYAFYVNISLYTVFKRKSYLEECHCPPACDLLHTEFLWKHLVSLGHQLWKHVVSFQFVLPKKGHRDLELSWYHDSLMGKVIMVWLWTRVVSAHTPALCLLWRGGNRELGWSWSFCPCPTAPVSVTVLPITVLTISRSCLKHM